jgi:hypothetical protein
LVWKYTVWHPWFGYIFPKCRNLFQSGHTGWRFFYSNDEKYLFRSPLNLPKLSIKYWRRNHRSMSSKLKMRCWRKRNFSFHFSAKRFSSSSSSSSSSSKSFSSSVLLPRDD